MCPLPHLLCGATLWRGYAFVWRQNQQREHDKVPTDAEGELLGPGEEAGVLSQWGRDEVLHGLNESQPRRHPKVGSNADPSPGSRQCLLPNPTMFFDLIKCDQIISPVSFSYMCSMQFLISKLIDIFQDMYM